MARKNMSPIVLPKLAGDSCSDFDIKVNLLNDTEKMSPIVLPKLTYWRVLDVKIQFFFVCEFVAKTLCEQNVVAKARIEHKIATKAWI